MNWNSLKHTFQTGGAQAARTALEQLSMKALKHIAETRCIIQFYERSEYAGSGKKIALIAKIYEQLLNDIQGDLNPSEATLQRRFLGSQLRAVFQAFTTQFPHARPSDFWSLIQQSIPAERWNGGHEYSPITGRARNARPKPVEFPLVD